MDERLTSGAMPPEGWTPPPDPPPAPDARTWFPTGLPGGATVDPHPGDVPDPGVYQAPVTPPHADARTALAYDRARHAAGSPHVFRMTTCGDCGTAVTYYGRADQAPDPVRCPDCADTATATS